MRRQADRYSQSSNKTNFWPFFTNVMSTIVLVFFFVVLLTYFKQIVSKGLWESKIEDVETEFIVADKELKEVVYNIEEKELVLQEMNDAFEVLQDSNSSLIEEAKLQAEVVANKNLELETLKSKINEVSTIRLELITEIKEAIEVELGYTTDRYNNPIIELSENATLIINTNLLFPSDSDVLSEEGEVIVDKFATVFSKVLLVEENYSIISSINIEGHADSIGDYKENYNLSCRRSANVISHMMETVPLLRNEYGAFFAAVGFSEFRSYDSSKYKDNTVNSQNRRIEISISMKDSQFKDILEDYLNN